MIYTSYKRHLVLNDCPCVHTIDQIEWVGPKYNSGIRNLKIWNENTISLISLVHNKNTIYNSDIVECAISL